MIDEAVGRSANRRRGEPDQSEQAWTGRSHTDTDRQAPRPDLERGGAMSAADARRSPPIRIIEPLGLRISKPCFDVPVKVSAVLGRARMEVGELLKLGPGRWLALDRKSARRSTSTSRPPRGPRRGGAGRGQARLHHDRDLKRSEIDARPCLGSLPRRSRGPRARTHLRQAVEHRSARSTCPRWSPH